MRTTKPRRVWRAESRDLKPDTKRKLGYANARKRAGWDRSYLVELLCGG
jgi:hypothetical protein